MDWVNPDLPHSSSSVLICSGDKSFIRKEERKIWRGKLCALRKEAIIFPVSRACKMNFGLQNPDN